MKEIGKRENRPTAAVRLMTDSVEQNTLWLSLLYVPTSIASELSSSGCTVHCEVFSHQRFFW